MASYKCFSCEREVKMDYVRKKIRCPYCGSKVLYKVRTVPATVKAR